MEKGVSASARTKAFNFIGSPPHWNALVSLVGLAHIQRRARRAHARHLARQGSADFAIHGY
jgi:hypothetical protein